MIKRIFTAVILIIIFVPAIYFGGLYFLILGILLSMIASFEMMDMFSQKSLVLKNYRYIIPLFSGAIVYMIYFVTTNFLSNHFSNNYNNLLSLSYIFIFVFALLIIIGSMVFVRGSSAHDILAAVMTICYCGLIMGLVISIEYINPISFFPNSDGNWGRISFTYLISIVVMTDTFAYFVGSKYGKHKLCPNISPKKTIEGAIGGLLAGGIIGTLMAFSLGVVNFIGDTILEKMMMILIVFLVSIIISFTVQIGDLVASKLKRSYNIKDFGFIFPGHGGVLDRFDSLIFSGAIFYLFIQFIQLVVNI